jgi:hypothetical protein
MTVALFAGASRGKTKDPDSFQVYGTGRIDVRNAIGSERVVST